MPRTKTKNRRKKKKKKSSSPIYDIDSTESGQSTASDKFEISANDTISNNQSSTSSDDSIITMRSLSNQIINRQPLSVATRQATVLTRDPGHSNNSGYPINNGLTLYHVIVIIVAILLIMYQHFSRS